MKTTIFSKETPGKVKIYLESAREQRQRVRIFYGDTEREDFERVHGHEANPGKDWGEENDVIGYVGRSTGEQPIPLLIANSRSLGGGGILDDCIVRMFVKIRGTWKEVYRHPNYHSEYDNAVVVVSELAPEYSHAVKTTGGEVARFHSERSAVNYLAFMQGKRFAK